jgi:hypothetical protein
VQQLSAPFRPINLPTIAARDGVAVIAWGDTTSASRIFARMRKPNGTLGPNLAISAAGEGASDPSLAVDREGNAYVSWEQFPKTGPDEIYGRQIFSDRTLGPIEQISPSDDSGGTGIPLVGVDGRGTDVIVWRNAVRTRTQEGVLGPVQSLGVSTFTGDMDLAVAPNGNAIIVWDEGNDNLFARRLGPTGNLTAKQLISTTVGGDFLPPAVDVDAIGNATIVWGQDFPFTSSGHAIEARQRAANGVLGPEVTLADRHALYPDVAMTPTGQAAAAFQTQNRIQVSAGP